MKVLCRLAQVFACGLLVACLAPASFGALELRMAPRTETPNQLPGPVEVNFFLFWDGNGINQLNSINFEVQTPASVTLPDTETPPDPLGFAAGGGFSGFRDVRANSVAFARTVGNVADLAAGETLLTTLTFQTTQEGIFNIGLRLVEASQIDGQNNIVDITSQFTSVSGGVIVVPEPSSMALLGLVSVIGLARRRR